VLEGNRREYQFVELCTFICSATAALLLFICALRLWRSPNLDRTDLAGRRGAFLIVGLITLATTFFAGEEISWGQTYFGWATPEALNSEETNLHNIDDFPINIKSLGSLFLIIMFIALPLAWRAGKLNLPRTWEPAIAERPIIFSMVVAFFWKFFKDVYRRVPGAKETVFYDQFVEQLNEQKEMLVAVTLLMYALYRLSATRRRPKTAGTS